MPMVFTSRTSRCEQSVPCMIPVPPDRRSLTDHPKFTRGWSERLPVQLPGLWLAMTRRSYLPPRWSSSPAMSSWRRSLG